jgi:hypothetical protein
MPVVSGKFCPLQGLSGIHSLRLFGLKVRASDLCCSSSPKTSKIVAKLRRVRDLLFCKEEQRETE